MRNPFRIAGLLVAFIATSALAQSSSTVSIARNPTLDNGGYAWSTGTYEYDASGNITRIGDQYFRYDVNGRLTSAVIEGPDQATYSTRGFTYDDFGNLRSKTLDGVTTTIAVDEANNHVTAFSADYDSVGNLTTWHPPNSAYRYDYTYDAFDMMQMAVIGQSNADRIYYVYTADDQRLYKFDNRPPYTGSATVRDLSGNVLRRFDITPSGGTIVFRDYVYRGSTMLAANVAYQPGKVEHFSVDHLGTPRLITDAGKNKLGYHVYAPFGEEWFPNTGVLAQEGDPKKFTGHERDDGFDVADASLDYMHARYYSAALGRFLSVDPTTASADSSTPVTWNRYAYVINSPVNQTDPDGRDNEAAFDRQVMAQLKSGRKPYWAYPQFQAVGLVAVQLMAAATLGQVFPIEIPAAVPVPVDVAPAPKGEAVNPDVDFYGTPSGKTVPAKTPAGRPLTPHAADRMTLTTPRPGRAEMTANEVDEVVDKGIVKKVEPDKGTMTYHDPTAPGKPQVGVSLTQNGQVTTVIKNIPKGMGPPK